MFCWDLSDALRRESLFYFQCKIDFFSATRDRNRYNFGTIEGKYLKFRTYMKSMWTNFCANFGGNQLRDTGFQVKKLKCQSEVQTVLAQKLIAEGE